MSWRRPLLLGAVAGALTGTAAVAAWYFMFPPGAPESYFVVFAPPGDRYATLDVDRGYVLKIVVLFSCLGAAIAIGVATLRRRLEQRRQHIFDAVATIALSTLAASAISATVYQVDHQFDPSSSPGHWPSTRYDYLVPVMPAIGLVIGIACAVLLSLSRRRGADKPHESS